MNTKVKLPSLPPPAQPRVRIGARRQIPIRPGLFLALAIGFAVAGCSTSDTRARHQPNRTPETTQAVAPSRHTQEALAWEEAKARDTVDSYEDFLAKYPDGRNRSLARNALAEKRLQKGVQQMQSKTASEVITSAGSTNATTRLIAVRALGKLPTPDAKAIDRLIASLEDPAGGNRAEAAEALGELAKKAFDDPEFRRANRPLCERVIESLIRLMKRDSGDALDALKEGKVKQWVQPITADDLNNGGYRNVSAYAGEALSMTTGKRFEQAYGMYYKNWQNWWEENREKLLQ